MGTASAEAAATKRGRYQGSAVRERTSCAADAVAFDEAECQFGGRLRGGQSCNCLGVQYDGEGRQELHLVECC